MFVSDNVCNTLIACSGTLFSDSGLLRNIRQIAGSGLEGRDIWTYVLHGRNVNSFELAP